MTNVERLEQFARELAAEGLKDQSHFSFMKLVYADDLKSVIAENRALVAQNERLWDECDHHKIVVKNFVDLMVDEVLAS